MREGWEWDPLTGEREPLRDDMRTAVNEGRVGYDNSGSLVILNQQSDAGCHSTVYSGSNITEKDGV